MDQSKPPPADVQSGALPLTAATDPIFAFADSITDHLPSRKQRLYALAYLRALQAHPGKPLRHALPPALYRPVRHFIADADWDGRQVLWRAVARVLPKLEVEWLTCRVTALGDRYCFAWLGAETARHSLPLDLILIGPARLIRAPSEYVPPQLELLRTIPTDLLARAPIGLGGVLGERADVRAWLAGRGLTYSASVRPGSRLIGAVVTGGRAVALPDYLDMLRKDGVRGGVGEVWWRSTRIVLRLPGKGAIRAETMIAYWHHGHVAGVAFTNENDPAILNARYDPSRADFLAGPRSGPPWVGTTLRGARAWEHHLALWAVLELYRLDAAQD